MHHVIKPPNVPHLLISLLPLLKFFCMQAYSDAGSLHTQHGYHTMTFTPITWGEWQCQASLKPALPLFDSAVSENTQLVPSQICCDCSFVPPCVKQLENQCAVITTFTSCCFYCVYMCRAATNGYFQYWLICWLFLWLFTPWDVRKVLKVLISVSQSQMWHF